MTLAGLAGATPALRFADLLNNFLTGLSGPIPAYSLAVGRFGIDASASPGPTGGLLFDPTTTTAGTFVMPMTATSTGLGIAENFEDDVDNYFTLTSPTTLQINVSGKYHLSSNWCVFSSDPLLPVSVQVLRNGDTMFTAPPAVAVFTGGVSTGTTPISGLYTTAYSTSASADCELTAGDIIGCKLYAEGGSGGLTAETSQTCNLSIHLIGGTQAGAGTSGITSVINQTATGEELVANPGAGPVIGIKTITGSGTNMSVTSTANSVNISAQRTDLSVGDLPGAQAYRTINSFSYRFRRLTGGTGISVAEGASDAPNTITNTMVVNNATDTGESLVTGASPAYTVKRFKAGTNVTLSSDATSVTINSTAGVGGTGLINQQLISVTSPSTYPTPTANWLLFGEVAGSGVGTSPPTLSGVGSVINATGWYRCFAQVRLGNTSTASDFVLYFALSTDPTNSIDGGPGVVYAYPASGLRYSYWIEANAYLTAGDIVGLRITPLSADAQVVSLYGGFQRIN